MGFDYQGANTLDLVLDVLFLALNRRRVIPLYTQVDAQLLTESRPAHTQRVRLSDYLYLPYNTSYILMTVYTRGPQATFGSWSFSKPASRTAIFNIFMGLVIMNRQWYDPPRRGRVIPMAVHQDKAREDVEDCGLDSRLTKDPKPKGGLRPIGVNRHICMTYIVRQVYLVTEPDTLSMSWPELREPLGVNLCI